MSLDRTTTSVSVKGKRIPLLGGLSAGFSRTFTQNDVIPGSSKANKINLCSLSTVPMRAFHMTWMSFFLCFFGWFGLSPMILSVKEDLGLTTSQLISTTQASIGSTIVFRVLLGLICDRIGPRISYTTLMICGAFPVAFVGFAQSYEALLVGRLLIGTLGASFVVTQYHSSAMFSSRCVGTANAITAGWGNLGGGVTNLVMPFVALAVLKIRPDLPPYKAWRYANILPAFVLVIQGVLYSLITKDSPKGNKVGAGAYANTYSFMFLNTIKANAGDKLDRADTANLSTKGLLWRVFSDYRLYVLMFTYGSCFGIELIMLGNSSIYLQQKYGIAAEFAGVIIFIFSSMNLFARGIGGGVGDKFGNKWGVRGRVYWLSVVLCCEGLVLVLWSRLDQIEGVIAVTFVFGLFVMMCEGATFSVVPFLQPRALGLVSGMVGAGGNLGAVIGLTLFKSNIDWSDCFMYLGCWVIFVSMLVLTMIFKFPKGLGKQEPTSPKSAIVPQLDISDESDTKEFSDTKGNAVNGNAGSEHAYGKVAMDSPKIDDSSSEESPEQIVEFAEVT